MITVAYFTKRGIDESIEMKEIPIHDKNAFEYYTKEGTYKIEINSGLLVDLKI